MTEGVSREEEMLKQVQHDSKVKQVQHDKKSKQIKQRHYEFGWNWLDF